MMEETEFAIIGGGPAGLSAALEAARHGVQVVLVDENEQPGGQLFKQTHKFFGSRRHGAGVRGFAIGRQLLEEASQQPGLNIRLGTAAYGLFPDRSVAVVDGCGRSSYIRAANVLLATGAREKVLNFPGWHLPGVLGAGAAQTLMNVHRVLPGRRVLVVGAGNIGLILSYQLLQAGATEVTVVEAAPRIGGWDVHRRKIERLGVPVLTSHTVGRALGTTEVEAVEIAVVDERWRPLPGTERRLVVDAVCIAVGLSPLSELLQAASPAEGTWAASYEALLETGAPGVFLAGDVSGIDEASTAMEEGRLVGITVAERLGKLGGPEAEKLRTEVLASLRELRLRTHNLDPFLHGFSAPEMVYRGGLVDDATRASVAASGGYPSSGRIETGPGSALIECFEAIPCDACVDACPKGAITIEGSINNLPRLNEERCDGCGLCVAACPGLAIWTADCTSPDGFATMKFPYEFRPLPQVGDRVEIANRRGEVLGRGKVARVQRFRQADTSVLSVSVPKALVWDARAVLPAQSLEEHPILGPIPKERTDVTVDGAVTSLRAGIPVAVALWEEGHKVLNSSPGLHLPRGVLCALGRCASCSTTIDGVPGVKACVTPVRPGMTVETVSGQLESLDDDVLVCRCRDVVAADLRRALREGALEAISEVKKATNVCMGECRGATCGETVRRIVGEETGLQPVSPKTESPPLRPVTVYPDDKEE